jgi:hypothetical protein
MVTPQHLTCDPKASCSFQRRTETGFLHGLTPSLPLAATCANTLLGAASAGRPARRGGGGGGGGYLKNSTTDVLV